MEFCDSFKNNYAVLLKVVRESGKQILIRKVKVDS